MVNCCVVECHRGGCFGSRIACSGGLTKEPRAYWSLRRWSMWLPVHDRWIFLSLRLFPCAYTYEMPGYGYGKLTQCPRLLNQNITLGWHGGHSRVKCISIRFVRSNFGQLPFIYYNIDYPLGLLICSRSYLGSLMLVISLTLVGFA